MIKSILSFKKILSNIDDSDAFLCAGVELLVIGISFVSIPAACVVTGLIFCGLSIVVAKNGDSFPTI